MRYVLVRSRLDLKAAQEGTTHTLSLLFIHLFALDAAQMPMPTPSHSLQFAPGSRRREDQHRDADSPC